MLKMDGYMDAIVADIVKILDISSVSTDKEGVRKALRFVVERAKQMGLHAESLLDDQVGVVEIGEGDVTVGVLSHVDVVDPGDEEKWESPPFKGTIKDGWIFGRGIIDDKGPTIVILYALKALVDHNVPLNKKIKLIIGTQEEVAWTDLEAYHDAGYPLPDYGFTPDGDFPLENREKGYADVENHFKLKAPSNNAPFEVCRMEAGESPNSIPGKAEAWVKGNPADFKAQAAKVSAEDLNGIEVTEKDGLIYVAAMGQSTHSSVPERGCNSISVICKFLSHFQLADNGFDRLVQFVCDTSLADHYGKKFGLYRESEYYNGEYFHRTVNSPTVMHSFDDYACLNFNLRHTMDISKRDIQNGFDAHGKTYGFDAKIVEYQAPNFVSSEQPFIRVMAEAYEEVSGFKNEFNLAHGTSYAKAMPNIVAWGPVFPGAGLDVHCENEKDSIENILNYANVYLRALERMGTEI